MSYKVEIKKSAVKSLDKLPKRSKILVIKKLSVLTKFPDVSNVRKLSKPLNGYRMRMGDYRALFTIDSRKKLITVYTIDHRKTVYG